MLCLRPQNEDFPSAFCLRNKQKFKKKKNNCQVYSFNLNVFVTDLNTIFYEVSGVYLNVFEFVYFFRLDVNIVSSVAAFLSKHRINVIFSLPT